jgi:hypothetical protein
MKVVSLSALHTGRSNRPMKYSWYSFLLEAESNSGSYCGPKDYVNENSNDMIGNRTRGLPACSTSTPLAPPPSKYTYSFIIQYHTLCNMFQLYLNCCNILDDDSCYIEM